jgi:hypothetical protein
VTGGAKVGLPEEIKVGLNDIKGVIVGDRGGEIEGFLIDPY